MVFGFLGFRNCYFRSWHAFFLAFFVVVAVVILIILLLLVVVVVVVIVVVAKKQWQVFVLNTAIWAGGVHVFLILFFFDP